MKKIYKSLAIITVLSALMLTIIPSTLNAQSTIFFRIGTGSAGGTYFPIGGTIANNISAPPGARPCDQGGQCGVPGMIAIAQSTAGSVSNNQAVQNGDLEAGLASAEITRSMYLGEGDFEANPHQKLRIVANLYSEDIHLVLPKGQSIKDLNGLRNKRVGIERPGSGTQVIAMQMLKMWGITRDDIEGVEVATSKAAELLADGELDAFFFIAGWPVSAISELANSAGMELHSFADEDVARITKAIPPLISVQIPDKIYEGVNYSVNTSGVSALLIVSADMDEELVYQITKAMWNENSRKLLDNGHMKGKQITLETALDGVLTIGVPLHEGAMRYYKEQGLM